MAMLAGLALTGRAPAEAAATSAGLDMAAHVGPRATVRSDRDLVRLEPGEQVDVTVIVKARLAAGATAAVILETVELDGGEVRYRFAGVEGRLERSTTLGSVSTSGIHALPLTLVLSPRAHRPVVLPLRFRARPDATPLVVGRSADGSTVVEP